MFSFHRWFERMPDDEHGRIKINCVSSKSYPGRFYSPWRVRNSFNAEDGTTSTAGFVLKLFMLGGNNLFSLDLQ